MSERSIPEISVMRKGTILAQGGTRGCGVVSSLLPHLVSQIVEDALRQLTMAAQTRFAHRCRACCTISTRTFLVSAGLLTSRKNAMRAPRMPPWVFMRT
jgi:hypothetical protein